MSGYHVGSNVPGYLPDGEPYHVEAWEDALAMLRSDILSATDDLPWDDDTEDPTERAIGEEYAEALATINTLQVAAPGIEGGDISFTLPASSSIWDLGRAYWIMVCTEDDCTEVES